MGLNPVKETGVLVICLTHGFRMPLGLGVENESRQTAPLLLAFKRRRILVQTIVCKE